MSSFLYRLGRLAARRRGLVLLFWLLLLGLAGGGAAVLGQGTDDAFSIPGSESQDALDHLRRVFPEVSGASAQVVVITPGGIDTPGNRAAVAEAVTKLKAVDQVAMAVDPFGPDVRDAVAKDGRAAIIAVPLRVQLAEIKPGTRTAVTAIAHGLADRTGARVLTGGEAFADKVPKLSPTEGLGLVIALVVLVVMFGSLLAAGMPLLTAVLGVGVSVGLVYAATAVATVSSTAPMLAVMLGLAVGIDYALFLLSRHRDQLAEGLAVEESVARATATAGSAVIFAGLTVVIALLGLAVAGIPFLTVMGIAASVAVAVAVLIAITLIPALLACAGNRLRPKAPRQRKSRKPRRRLGLAWVRMATKRPVLTVVAVVALLGLATVPAFELRLALPDNGTEEEHTPAREAYDAVSEHFGPGFNGPLIVTADILASRDPIGVVNGIAEDLRRVQGVATVPLATPNPKGDTGIIQVVPTTGADDPATGALVERLRGLRGELEDRYGVATAVTGFTAVAIDVSDQLGRSLLPFGVLVVGLSLVLLAMVFRSILVPVKATVGYLLSIGAAFGATAFVFNQGHLAELFGVTRTGSVISFLPIILMGVLFGLAMDYEAFLVSRIREDFVHGGDPHRAIETGFVSASRVVVAAALIMFAVFAAFVPEGSSTIKPIAFSLAVGVFVDAFIVRMTLVPAVLALLGRRAWGLPPWLDRRLPVFDAEGDNLMHELRLADWPAPGSDEVVSARGLHVEDDRGEPVVRDVELHLRPGEVLAVRGSGPVGKTALLYTLAGRVPRLRGDLKVCGAVLPQHVHAVRGRLALLSCATEPDPAARVRRALDDGLRLLVLDDLDRVVVTEQRQALRELIASRRAAVVVSCQATALVADLLPPHTQTLDLQPLPAEVS
ncbi:RND superfamily putative drug exporter [Crossiella equi]|uniref:RND superfamily putative drug exporter n=1 Tax=Crossiella equi TaxID=130796 RepID=A0ABS5AQQ8_9PSEU|nr:MMPL family transporter [Crossiella equi]MBP2478903.1 RND superfamily putative drug exporter [Crossiella equi]